ncbi:hypothetical protein N3K63_01680 [Microbacterium sp. W1N]|uniref:hypothetical protein n=1 Tax=Microbacterium festucae TaxID=2977531 RepID=UPI0021BFC0FB|nr:hypothetical protein [Microbacterium festucae]MCT9818990.1 hypothetical protein [Microbacterium festucae]
MLTEVFRALGRRWYVVVVGLLMTGALAYGAYTLTPTQYTSRGLILLLPSEEAATAAGNPFLALSGLEQPAGVVVAYFASSSAQNEIADLSPTAEYLVAIDDSTRGPAISVNVTDVSAESSLSTLEHLMTRVPEELARIQNELDVPAEAAVGSMTLTADEAAEPDRSGTIRMTIAAVAVGVLLTGISAFALDGILLRRARRTAQREEDATETGDHGPGSPAAGPTPAHDEIGDPDLLLDPQPVPARSRRG